MNLLYILMHPILSKPFNVSRGDRKAREEISVGESQFAQ
jgi:hypothetical protein